MKRAPPWAGCRSANPRTLRRSDWLPVFDIFVLNALVTIVLGCLIVGLFHGTANHAAARIADAPSLDTALFFLSSTIRILGEELLTIPPFLAFLTLLARFLPSRLALVLAALGASAIFVHVHFPTSKLTAAQSLVGLVPIRTILLAPFVIARNIWTSTGAHVLNDWAIFGLAILGGADVAGS